MILFNQYLSILFSFIDIIMSVKCYFNYNSSTIRPYTCEKNSLHTTFLLKIFLLFIYIFLHINLYIALRGQKLPLDM